MNTKEGRIPRKISEFIAYLVNTANYLFAESPPITETGTAAAAAPAPMLNWQRLNMLETDAALWNKYRRDAIPLYEKYTDENETRTRAITDKLQNLRKRFNAFAQPQLDAIATWRGSTIDDFEVFRIHAGALRDTTKTHSDITVTIEPSLDIIKMKHLVHVLLCTFEDTKKRRLPKGVKEINVYVAKTASANDEPANNAYQYAGDVKRGYFYSVFDSGNDGLTAWYKARVKTTTGDFGPWSEVVKALIA